MAAPRLRWFLIRKAPIKKKEVQFTYVGLQAVKLSLKGKLTVFQLVEKLPISASVYSIRLVPQTPFEVSLITWISFTKLSQPADTQAQLRGTFQLQTRNTLKVQELFL